MTIRQLRLTSISYLMLPNLIFFSFWTNYIVAALSLGICAWLFLFELRDTQFPREACFKWSDLLKIALGAAVLTLLSGVCGFFYQTSDYWAHNTKFYELYKYDWPLRIPARGPVVGYYYGYYIVPALVSKAIGHFSEAAIFCWTILGISLGICWLYLTLGHRFRYILLVLTLGDFAHVCCSLFSKILHFHYPFEEFGIEMWSNFENLFWVPNQIIPSMIIGGMLVHCVMQGIAPERLVLPIVLSFWWAIFPAFTSAILVGTLIVRKWLIRPMPGFTSELACIVLLPCLMVVPVLLLFLSHERPAVIGWIWNFTSMADNRALEYTLNVVLNAAVMILLYRYFSIQDKTRKLDFPFFVIVCMILAMPLIRIGKVNDFLFRGYMPLLIAAGVCIYQYGLSFQVNKSLTSLRTTGTAFLVTVTVLGSSVLAAERVLRALENNRVTAQLLPNSIYFKPIPYDAYSNVYEVLKTRWSQEEADQYLGKDNSLYERFIAPK